jgi:hypothetical protein
VDRDAGSAQDGQPTRPGLQFRLERARQGLQRVDDQIARYDPETPWCLPGHLLAERRHYEQQVLDLLRQLEQLPLAAEVSAQIAQLEREAATTRPPVEPPASVSAPAPSGQKPRRRRRKITIDKIRTALLDRARHPDQAGISQELVARDLGVDDKTLRAALGDAGTDWETERRAALRHATDGDVADGS